MKIYLAARYSRQAEMRAIRESLRAAGHEVLSRWLDIDVPHVDGRSSSAPHDKRMELACQDLDDIMACQIMVNFTEEPTVQFAGRGGRHVEFGIAYAANKYIIVVGPEENIFHSLVRCVKPSALLETIQEYADKVNSTGR